MGHNLFWIALISAAFILGDGRPLLAQGRGKVSGPVVRKILLSGFKKIEEDAIRAKLQSKEGKSYSLELVREDVKTLFKTGYFYDVVVSTEDVKGGVLLKYDLVEKPAIAEIVYDGNEELDDDEIKEATEIKAYEILDAAKIRTAIEKIEKLYEDKGFFLARVDSKVEKIEKDENVRLKFKIHENEMVQVKRINILGNRQITGSKLKSMMETKEGGFFSFMSGSGAYKQDAFDRDVQRLNFIYFNEGFVQVKVDRPQVYVSPDKTGIYITIRLEEGERFNVGSVDFAGDLLFDEEELRSTTDIKPGERFSYEVLQKDLRDVQAKYGDLGYAYTNVIPRTRIREKDREVDVTYEIDKGNKVYIGKINVKGNSKTRDKVVRREMQIREGELYNETRKRESLANIKRLGFFEEVNFNTSTPANQPDQMNIDIVVKERNTGTIQVGAGYSSYSKAVFNGQVSQINFLGKGQRLTASLEFNSLEQRYNLNFTEPYFMDTKWELGFDFYRNIRGRRDYTETETGGAVRVGHPFAKYLRGVLGVKTDYTDLDLVDDGDEDLFPVDTAEGETRSLTFSLIYDKRNDRFVPTKGNFAQVSLEYASFGGDLNYTKGLANFRHYKKVFWEVVWRNNISYGIIAPNKSDEDIPFNQLFLLGGAQTLRGYQWFSIGKKKYSDKAYQQAVAAGDPDPDTKAMVPFGGTQQIFYNMEFQFPLVDEAGIQGVVFYDVGSADDNLILEEVRQDVGFGFRWYSPIGPLRFEWGFPIDREKEFDEPASNFQFSIGSPF